MTKFIKMILPVLGLSVLLLSTGCVTTNQGGAGGTNAPVITQAQLDKSATLLRGTVRASLIVVIDKEGVKATPYIALARDTLSLFIGGSNYSPDALLKSIEALPAKALQKPEVQLAISAVVSAYEIYYGDYVSGKLNGNAAAVELLTAVRDGIADALALAPPATP